MKKIIILCCLLAVITLLSFSLPLKVKEGRFKIYPAPSGVSLSTDYKVSIAGNDVPVYTARVARADQRTKEISETYFDTASFAYFDMAGPVSVTVKAQVKINTVKILPAFAGIVAHVSGKTVTFTVSEPKNLTIEINGEWVRSLHVFANPPETNIPKPNDSTVVYFGPGLHEVSQITLGDNKTLYIAGGAVVRAIISPEEKQSGRRNLAPTIVLRGKNITVRGRGIIDAGLCPTHSRNMFQARGSDIKFEGIIMLDACTWFMPIRQSDRVSVDNIKLIGYRSNSDGIDIANCRDVTVENCFIRTSDDLIVIKTDRKQGKANHIIARNCVLWNQFAHALSIGAELREDIDDVVFTNCDVIHDKGREWTLRVYHCDSSVISNVRFENIRIEDSRRLISLWIGKAVWTLDKYQRGHIQGVVFKDIKAEGSPLTIALVGYDDKHGINDVTFQNVTLNKKPVVMEDIQANAYVKNIMIKP